MRHRNNNNRHQGVTTRRTVRKTASGIPLNALASVAAAEVEATESPYAKYSLRRKVTTRPRGANKKLVDTTDQLSGCSDTSSSVSSSKEEEEEENIPLAQPITIDEVDEDEDDIVLESEEDSGEDLSPSFCSTSRKRKERFDYANAHLQPLATPPSKRSKAGSDASWTSSISPRLSVPVMPDAPKTKRTQKIREKTPSSHPKINWAKRKMLVSEHDNGAYVDPMIGVVMDAFKAVGVDVRGGNSSLVGPMMLYNLLPAFMKAVEETPWGYWVAVRRGEEEMNQEDADFVFFVQWPYGAVAEVLTEKQVKFRQVCLAKVATIVEERAQTLLGLSDIKVVWSKAFGENRPY